jgi:hypothetical protein
MVAKQVTGCFAQMLKVVSEYIIIKILNIKQIDLLASSEASEAITSEAVIKK